MRILLVSGWAALLGACTTLGPMPAMTGTTPLPPERPSLELQLAVVPGTYLSSAVQDEQDGAPIGQLALVAEIGRLLALPGLTVGGRYVGKDSEGGFPEPMLGYRAYLDASRQIAMAVMAFGTRADGENDGASYRATRIGGEVGFDVRLTAQRRWIELHVVGVASATALWARGTYCVDVDGRYGVDCPDPPDPIGPMDSVKGSGLYPAGVVSFAIDSGRHLDQYFHGIRGAVSVAGGTTPRVEFGEQKSATVYATFGLSLTIAFGAAASSPSAPKP